MPSLCSTGAWAMTGVKRLRSLVPLCKRLVPSQAAGSEAPCAARYYAAAALPEPVEGELMAGLLISAGSSRRTEPGPAYSQLSRRAQEPQPDLCSTLQAFLA